MISTYLEPVAKLLNYGECRNFIRNFKEWPDYLELGFTQEHVPELISMATSEDLYWADSESKEVWAPIHAWRTLGQLHAEASIEPLMQLFHELEHEEWVGEELPTVYQLIGPSALPALGSYLAEDAYGALPRATAADCLERIGNAYPEAKAPCLLALTDQLERYRDNDPLLNSFLICNLIELGSVESLPLVKRAFDSDSVDWTVTGDLEDVEIEFQVREHRSTPRQLSLLQKQIVTMREEIESLQGIIRRIKIGRNEPCPCGSGKKYKKCCLNR